MAQDEITLALKGDVPIGDFALAMQHLSALVAALSTEIVGAEVEWEIARLHGGSASVTLRGRAAGGNGVERITAAYMAIGEALERDGPIPYSDEVADHARALTAFIDGKVTSVEFATNGHVATVTAPSGLGAGREPLRRWHSVGVVTGTIETVSVRGSLTCTLYDPIFDRAIKCQMSDEHKETVRRAWGQRVAITGDIERDPLTGRPMTVRNVKRIEVQEKQPNGHVRARGVLPWQPGDELPEIRIRRSRDGE